MDSTAGNISEINHSCDLVKNFYAEKNNHNATAVDEPTLEAFLKSNKIYHLPYGAFWAALWVMPATKPHALYQELRQPELSDGACLHPFESAPIIPAFIDIFRGKDPEPSTKYSSRTPKIKRNQRNAESALERDNFKYVITDALNPEVCHIFPFASLN
ncbi:hypothetical protein CSUB01_02269 [Colletotrichum sublineola]|uniref:Uncharacterized protein n=1 Tax=Colletotrichum sublineola TaxID=1173701 RepID=A0A066X0R0_COLSU|nr:hypothetical protein CSUB01_02269 [Colletotrichum sublineola]